MGIENTDELIKKNELLQKSLSEKEKELARYRSEIKKLNTQLRELIVQINQEIKMSQVIQKTLVPTELPNIPGFDFSTKFIASLVTGGDYFDLFEHDDKFRFGVVLSSASGYGMSALFLSVLMKLSGQIEARRGTPANQSLAAIIQELLPSLQPNDSADVFYGVVDRRTFELSYCLAGEVVALHQHATKSDIIRLDKGAPAIAAGFNTNLENQIVSLNARDRIVVCSRGIFHAPNARGEAFGVKRIEDIMFAKKDTSVHEVRNEILYQVERWTGKTEPDRDLTVLVIEVKERILKLARV